MTFKKTSMTRKNFQSRVESFLISVMGWHCMAEVAAASLRAPLKTTRERPGYAITGSLILDGYKHAKRKENSEVAKLA